jgi:uncharacterized protein (UPF0335 family)
MTPAEGFGMLAMGLIAIAIGATCFYLIIKRMERLEKEEKEMKERTKIYGRDI